MVSPELEAEYARRNIGVIAPDEGVDALVRELIWGDRLDAQVIYACANAESMDGDVQRNALEQPAAVGVG